MSDYEVGYKKPPEKTRFKQGQSGNPKGRPKVQTDFATEFDRQLNQLVGMKANGKPIKIKVFPAVLKRLIKLALEGDIRAISLILKHKAAMSAKSLSKVKPMLAPIPGNFPEILGKEEWTRSAMAHQAKLLQEIEQDELERQAREIDLSLTNEC